MDPRVATSLPVGLRVSGASLLLLVALLAAPACASRRCPTPNRTVAAAAKQPVPGRSPEQRSAVPVLAAPARGGDDERATTHAFYDGAGGSPSDLQGFLRLAEGASLIAFGELHGDPVGSAMELRLLESLVAQEKPVALALEFFEADAQGDLDAYLAGRTTEEEFVRSTKRDDAYARTHRPLVELCKRHRIPVIAANAPRRLVSAYRVSERSYPDYLAGLDARERSYLPAATTVVDDRHRDRFTQLMGPERGARLFKSMSLWDDAMAESVVRFQEARPAYRVLLVVGSFHVTDRLGTIAKYLSRVHQASARVLLMSYSTDGTLAFEEGDKGTGDFILKVRPPPARSRSE